MIPVISMIVYVTMFRNPTILFGDSANSAEFRVVPGISMKVFQNINVSKSSHPFPETSQPRIPRGSGNAKDSLQ